MVDMKAPKGSLPTLGEWYVLAEDYEVKTGRSAGTIIPHYDLGYIARERCPGVYIFLFKYVGNLPTGSADVPVEEIKNMKFM